MVISNKPLVKVFIKDEKVINKIVAQISLDDVRRAISKCEWIVGYNKKNKVAFHTNCGNVYFDNPDFTIHSMIDKIIKNTLKND